MRVMAAAQLGIFLVAAALDWALLPVFTIFYFSLWLVAGEFFKNSTRASRDASASL
jgi:hypothetical protein